LKNYILAETSIDLVVAADVMAAAVLTAAVQNPGAIQHVMDYDVV